MQPTYMLSEGMILIRKEKLKMAKIFSDNFRRQKWYEYEVLEQRLMNLKCIIQNPIEITDQEINLLQEETNELTNKLQRIAKDIVYEYDKKC